MTGGDFRRLLRQDGHRHRQDHRHGNGHRLAYPQQGRPIPKTSRFAKNVLVVAPGLTVRNRLAVLQPSHPDNYYEAFRVVPPDYMDKLRQGKVVVHNWHALNWETDARSAGSVAWTSAGLKSDEAYVRERALDEIATRPEPAGYQR